MSIPHAGWALTLSGIKDLYDDPGMDFMGDTTRVFARICRGMVADEEETADVVATGTLREGMIDFLKRLATFRAEGPTPADCASALTCFGVSYFGRLWEVYARDLPPRGRSEGATWFEGLRERAASKSMSQTGIRDVRARPGNAG